MSFNEWCCQMEGKCPNFQFWLIVLKMEVVLFTFLLSTRTGNFQLYFHSLEKMIPWFFALDHFHYARWLSVHVSDMKMLEITEPGLYQVFNEFGCFIVSRTTKPFSSLELDQRHEQHNKDVKGHGGVLGLTKVERCSVAWHVDLRWLVLLQSLNCRLYYGRKKQQTIVTMRKLLLFKSGS